MQGTLHIIITDLCAGKTEERKSITSDGFTLKTDQTFFNQWKLRDVFNVGFFFPQLIFVYCWHILYSFVLFCLPLTKRRGFVKLLYLMWALVFGASHSGAGLMGGRFRCLKYWVTCWGSSARTDFARVSLGAWEEEKKTTHCVLDWIKWRFKMRHVHSRTETLAFLIHSPWNCVWSVFKTVGLCISHLPCHLPSAICVQRPYEWRLDS